MFNLIKQIIIVLLSSRSSLATKCVSFNDELTLIDLNPFEFKHYPFMINLDEFSGSCNVLSPKICVPMKIKDINLKAFNMIKNEIGAKAMSKHISCDCECKFNSTCNSNQK